MKQIFKALVAVLAGFSSNAAMALEVCDKPYWPYSEFSQAPAPFGTLLEQWPSGETARSMIMSHQERVRVDLRTEIGPCRPAAVPRFMDAMFGGIFSSTEEERLRAVNGFYSHFARSCRIVNWKNISAPASARITNSPHLVRYGNSSDALCGDSAIFLTLGSGLVAFQLAGGSCDVSAFTANRVRAVSLNSIFEGVHTEESIVERLFDYIGEGEAIDLKTHGKITPEHTKLGVRTLRGSQPMFPTLFRDQLEERPYGRYFDGRYYLIYPTINNPRGENNRYFPTFTSSLRIDVIDVTERESDRRFLRDACRRNQDNTDQPILNFQ